jgi:ketosteroid isomerase-like protein
MKSKNGVNIMLFVFITISICIISCQKNASKTETGILIKTDRDFSSMSEKEGMFKAFLSYIAEDGVILRDNSYPSKGKTSLKAYYEGKSDTSILLTWEPLFESISGSNDLGYTYGIYTSKLKTTGNISKGTYITIWRKQSDGSWKFVLDSGTQGLPDIKK